MVEEVIACMSSMEDIERWVDSLTSAESTLASVHDGALSTIPLVLNLLIHESSYPNSLKMFTSKPHIFIFTNISASVKRKR